MNEHPGMIAAPSLARNFTPFKGVYSAKHGLICQLARDSRRCEGSVILFG
jgi:hypothetical protein